MLVYMIEGHIFNCVLTVNEYVKSMWIKAKVVSGCLVAKLRRIPPVPCPHLTHAAPVCIRNSDLRSESVLCVHFEHSEHCVGLRYSFRDKFKRSQQTGSFFSWNENTRPCWVSWYLQIVKSGLPCHDIKWIKSDVRVYMFVIVIQERTLFKIFLNSD